MRRGTHTHEQSQRRAFKFGFRYTHFLYALSPRPPHRLLATSAEFCLAAAQDPNDCESVQFVSGLELGLWNASRHALSPLRAGGSSGQAGALEEAAHASNGSADARRLLLSYGVNDCEAKVAHIPLEQVWELLRPVDGEHDVCGSDDSRRRSQAKLNLKS